MFLKEKTEPNQLRFGSISMSLYSIFDTM